MLLAGGCSDPDPIEDPHVVDQIVSDCGPAARLVTDVCTQLGPDDGCVDVADVCIALCDGLPSCTVVSDSLRPLSGWPTAPDGYCVECATP